MKLKQYQSGVGLIEVLIAALVFAVGIAAAVQLQAVFFQNTSNANARSIAMGLAQGRLEQQRHFINVATYQAIQSSTADEIITPEEGKGNTIFSRSWLVTNYYYDPVDPNILTDDRLCHITPLSTFPSGKDANNNNCNDVVVADINGDGSITAADWIPDQKRIGVSVTWTDPDGSPQAVNLEGVINSNSGASAGSIIGDSGGGAGSGDAPVVTYEPSTDNRVTPIGVGTDTKRETLVPSSQVVGGYTRSKFTAYTYKGSTGELAREEEFQNVACDCRFNSTSSASDLTYTAAHPEWSSIKGTYIDVNGSAVSGKVKGCVQGGGSNCASNPDDMCNSCCRDHHDISSASYKYDPYRSSDDFETSSGDHKHYSGTNPVTSGQYLESCRMKRINGYWRVYQDWHMVDLTVLPLSDLTNSTTKALYANYVKAIIDEHLDEDKVSGQNLTSPPSKPSTLNHTTSNNYVTMAVDERRDLTARAVYLDYIDSAHLTAVKNLKTAGSDYLLHLPFYEIEVAQVASWLSADASKVKVGPYDGPGSSNDLYGGELAALATTSTAVDVTGSIKKSNSGILGLTQAVDYNASVNPDSETHSDSVKVCVGCTTGSCSLPWGGSILDNATVTAYQAANVAYGSSCTSQTRTCSSGTLSGSYQYESCTVGQPANCTFNGTTVNSGTSITAYQSGTVTSPATCQSETRTCTNGTLDGSFQFASCTVGGTNCTAPWGGSVSSGTSITAFQAASVAYGNTCVSENRTCTNGTLSGSYTNQTCTVGSPANCTFNGNTVNHGSSVTAYQTASVTYPNTCQSEQRTCTNGTLSGTYTNASCTAPTTCSSTVSGSKQGGATYTMSINGNSAIDCSISGNSYICPQQTIPVSGSTIVITQTKNANTSTQTVVSPNVCGAVTVNF